MPISRRPAPHRSSRRTPRPRRRRPASPARGRAALAGALRPPALRPGVAAGAGDHEHQPDEDQHRHDRPEQVGVSTSSSTAPSTAPRNDIGARRRSIGGGTHELLAVADAAGEAAGHQADVVRDVRGDRRDADQQQRREGDQGAGADDRVDRARPDAREDDEEGIERGHADTLCGCPRVVGGVARAAGRCAVSAGGPAAPRRCPRPAGRRRAGAAAPR